MPARTSIRRNLFMGNVVVFTNVTLDGVMQAPGRQIGGGRQYRINAGAEPMTAQVAQKRGMSRAQALGEASGILVLTFFGAYWGTVSAIFLGGTVQVIAFVLVGTVTLGCGGVGGMLLRAARAM